MTNVIPLRPRDDDNDDDTEHGTELAVIEPSAVELAGYDRSYMRPAKRLHKPTVSGMKNGAKRHARNFVERLAYELVKGIPLLLVALLRWFGLGVLYGVPLWVTWLCAGRERQEEATGVRRKGLFGRIVGRAAKGAAVNASRQADHLAVARWVGFLGLHVVGGYALWKNYGDPFQWLVLAPGVIALTWYGQTRDTRPAPQIVAPRPREHITVETMNAALREVRILRSPRPNLPEPGRVQLARWPEQVGSGTLATWVLPADCGKSNLDVLKQVERIAAAFNTPLDCFIMDPGSTPAEFTTWQAPRNPFAGPFKPHPLLGEPRWNVFQPIPFGHTAMDQTVTTALVYTAFLISAMPRRGKTFYARAILAGAVLDPLVEFIVLDCKPGHTWDSIRGLCKPGMFVNGRSNEAVGQMADALELLVAEMEAVGPRIPGSRITERTARTLGIPVRVIVFDEIQEALGNKPHGKRVHDALETIAKVGPAYGFVPFLITQRPDADTLDSDIRSVLPTRGVLEVDNWRDSDMGLGGTNMHEYGYDASKITNRGVAYFRPDRDADGQMDGDDSVRKVRAFDMSDDVWEVVCRVGLQLRGLDPELAASLPVDVLYPDVDDEQLTAAELWERITMYAADAIPTELVRDEDSLGAWLSSEHGLRAERTNRGRLRSRIAVERAIDVPLGCLAGSEVVPEDPDMDPDTPPDSPQT